MNRVMLFCAAACLPLTSAQADTDAREVGVEASIAFPSNGGVRNFRADDDRGVWIEDQRRNWYYASFMGHCRDIRWADAIGFDTYGSARLDRNSRLIVGNEVCSISRLVTADKPLPLSEQRRHAKEARKALGLDTLN
jgi:Family of unknown function (DUF6491)